ncbi:MAG TPA: hypothetical protein DCL77_05170 [Prolixibacteraceae bacterium]|nr:hypothetical protein [Prolixibacteraceae bacterium]
MIQIIALPEFEKDLKRLNKKYQSLKNEYLSYIESSEEKGPQGIHLGHNVYKARLAVKSKGKGKSGGLRIISYHFILTYQEDKIYLVAIYDKSEMPSIEMKKIDQIIKKQIGDSALGES